MKLSRARVTNYKSVLDSEWFTLDDLTCLVGKNESGKTAILEALEKINAVDKDRGELLETEYPRMLKSDYDESKEVDTAIETEWELADEEYAYLQSLAGEGVFTSHAVKISKDYNNSLNVTLDIDYDRAVKYLLDNSGLSEEDVSVIGEPDNTTSIFEVLEKLDEPSPRHQAFLQ